jgi:hypothetical protein
MEPVEEKQECCTNENIEPVNTECCATECHECCSPDSPESTASTESSEEEQENFLETMMSRFGQESTNADNPMSGIFAMLQNLVGDNQQVFQPMFNLASSQNINLNALNEFNMECMGVRSFLGMIAYLDDDSEELKRTASTLLTLLEPEIYDVNKELPEVKNLIKTLRKQYLRMVANALQEEMEKLESEINSNDSQEFTVSDLLALKDRKISI